MTERTKPADTTEENDESGKDGAQQIVDFGSALTNFGVEPFLKDFLHYFHIENIIGFRLYQLMLILL